MAQKNVRYPHTIGFRVTDETWFEIQREISNTDLTPHDWCRQMVLDALNQHCGLTKSERLLFKQTVGTHYLLAKGFQLFADNKMTSEECKKLRTFIKENINAITNRALADLADREAAHPSNVPEPHEK